MKNEHESVLKKETIDLLHIHPHGTYVDCTLGRAGHAMAIAERVTDGKVICFDQDHEAIEAARQMMPQEKTTLIHANFRLLKDELARHNITTVDGILFDLGVSSPQLDEGERGFSYRHDAPLDMRMDQRQSLTAYDIVNNWEFHELVKIFQTYGEERFAKQIARAIERNRKVKPIETTYELVDMIKEGIPAPARRRGGHPAKRVFQAIRIAVNDELNSFNDALHQAAEVLNIGGRIVVITFHSLEDRICKRAFQAWSTPKQVPKDLPILPEELRAPFKRITRKPVVPSEAEIKENRRARSAKLRVVEKVDHWDEQYVLQGERQKR